jgi:magnesium-transporting ATPase (P-type)
LHYDGSVYGTDDLITNGMFSVKHPSFDILYRIGVLCSRAEFEGDSKMKDSENTKKIHRETKEEEQLGLEMDNFDVESGGKKPHMDTSDEVNLTAPANPEKIVGDASETAILQFLNPIFPAKTVRQLFPKVLEVPFNSKNKWQFSVHKIPAMENREKFPEDQQWVFSGLPEDSFYVLVIKGAFERILPLCSKILLEGKSTKLEEEAKLQVENSAEKLACVGERVMGFASCFLDGEKFPEDFVFDTEEFEEKFFPVCDPPFFSFFFFFNFFIWNRNT